tara:strand:- start:97 stop:531 length:435 start_codon:yes stop_codon:yes gene_type:complete
MKKVIFSLVALSFCASANATVVENNDVATVKQMGSSFVERWKSGASEGLKGIVNKDFNQCKNFSKDTPLTIKHSALIKQRIEQRPEARKLAEPLFRTFMYEYSDDQYAEVMYSVFDEPEQIRSLCDDDDFSKNIIAALNEITRK